MRGRLVNAHNKKRRPFERKGAGKLPLTGHRMNPTKPAAIIFCHRPWRGIAKPDNRKKRCRPGHVRRDLQVIDRALHSAGVANLASGLFGGLVSYRQLGLLVMNIRAGAVSQWAVAWASLFCLAALTFGLDAPARVPRPVLGAQLLLLALLVMHHGVRASWGRLSGVGLALQRRAPTGS